VAYKNQTELQRKQYQIDKLKKLNNKIASKEKSRNESKKQSSVLEKSEYDDFFGFFSFLQFG
jgi:hypothetical protein